MVAPLAIIQARLKSTRLAGKMLLPMGKETLVARVRRLTVEAFGEEHTVLACPSADFATFSAALPDGAIVVGWAGPEWDLLGRFYHVAHVCRWHPDSIICRVTADDPFKDPALMRRVAAGERFPVETSCEAFTLAQLDSAQHNPYQFGEGQHQARREHITDALFPFRLPTTGVPGDTIDTQADYEAALKRLGEESALPNTQVTGDLDDPQMGEFH